MKERSVESGKIIYFDRRRRKRDNRERSRKLASLSATVDDFARHMREEIEPFLGDLESLPHGRKFLDACDALSLELEAQSKIIWLKPPQL